MPAEPPQGSDPHGRREPPSSSAPTRTGRRRQRIAYLVMMSVCALLVILAWSVIRIVSVPAAIGMSVVAALIPPFAAIVANAPEDHDQE